MELNSVRVPAICSYNAGVQFEWDEAKRRGNLHKHGIDFTDIPSIFHGDVLTLIDDRLEYDETRYITLGLLKGRTIVVVHTESEDVIRIISARKATRYEEQEYFKRIAD
jgi:uncharacterized DUF497 family protein